MKFLTSFFIVIFSLTSLPSMAQNNDDYKAEWLKVTALEKKGLTATALTEVSSIFEKAKNDKNNTQQIKAAMYIMVYRNRIEEFSGEKNIFYLDTLIDGASIPAKNILQSMQAQILWNYKQNNRYKFYNRTALAEETSADISTWSLQKLNRTITAYYNASLSNEKILQGQSLSPFEAILQGGKNTRKLRPTLFDLLAHRALAYFKSTENDVADASYKFIINDEKFYAEGKEFARLKIESKDTASLYLNALQVYQKLLLFHSPSQDVEVFLDVDMDRLEFVNQHAVLVNKAELYDTALINIAKKHPKTEAAAEAQYLRANFLQVEGNKYRQGAEGDETKYKIKQAKALYQEIINTMPNSTAAIKSKNALSQIAVPSLNISTEKVNVINEPFRSLVTFKNVDKLYLRLIKVTRDQLKAMELEKYDAKWESLAKLKPVKSWEQNLPSTDDFQTHSTEIKIDALPGGMYILLGSLKTDFSLTNNIIARQITYVSNISQFTSSYSNVFVVERSTGAPLPGATIQLYEEKYDYKSREYSTIKREQYTTDKEGFAFIQAGKAENRGSTIMQIKYGSDELFTDDHFYLTNYNSYSGQERKQTFLFTDRSIYRPGQTIFFKGIMVKSGAEQNKSEVLADEKTTVILYDANYKKQGTVRLMTNSYGSYNGSFTLPEGLLNGRFNITDSISNSTISISVEEYKRPKFSVEIKKPEGSYRVNDSITVTGTAKAYAGNNIDGAQVKYRVVRKVRYPVWWGWYRPYYQQGNSMEITNGFTTTDEKGEFKIVFKAIPDESVDKKGQPTFYYEVSTDITDAGGETRSGNTSVAVAYQAIQLTISTPEKITSKELESIKVKSENINGIYDQTTATLTITALQEPTVLYRDRFWQAPDMQILSKDAYRAAFPYDPYLEENKMVNWPKGNVVFTSTQKTAVDGKWNFDNKKLASGWYEIKVTATDKYGEEVEARKFIKISAEKDESKLPIETVWSKETSEPGDKISYTYKTGYEKIWLYEETFTMDKEEGERKLLTINKKDRYSNNINISEADRGGINLSQFFVKHNRLYTNNDRVQVPWSNKDLQIDYSTFRDKLLPGAEEKWTIKISGEKAEKKSAEALISMYDASLDQFKMHNWASLKGLWSGNGKMARVSSNNFTMVQSDEKSTISQAYISVAYTTYDQLLDNGWSNAGYQHFAIGYNNGPALESAASPAMAPRHMKLSKEESEVTDDALQGKVSGLNLSKDGEADSTSISSEEARTNEPVAVRTNFNETAFFFPDLHTDKDGNISFSFTMPESVTEWKMMSMAHDSNLASGYIEKKIVTQKPLMVQPNASRFLREGDKMEFSAKVVNITDKEITGMARLELLNAETETPVDGWFQNVFPTQYFTVAAGQSVAVKFPMAIPTNYNNALMYRITAVSTTKDSSGNTFSDGESAALPVLTNRMLVTETLPLNVRNTSEKTFQFKKLLESENSPTLSQHAFTIEYSSNPAWYAVQALPYLMEYPYECAEQTFNRYYANVLAAKVANSTPKIKAVFEKWMAGGKDSAALMSNLQKNEELKAVLLEETPWVLAAENEAAQKKNIGILFNMVRLAKEKTKQLAKLKEMQSSNGGFTWFRGGPDNRYMTQYIITGIGHLMQLGALDAKDKAALMPIVKKALPYLDARIKEDYDYLIRNKVKLDQNNLSHTAIQYLYMRSFFTSEDISNATTTAYKYYYGQAQKYWLQNSKYDQGMIALALHRTKDAVTPKGIIASLRDNAIYNEEMGMYWKEFSTGGYYWYQAPIESQAMMIEAFAEIDKKPETINDLKTWLLKQKQTQNWKTTKATAEACYALLLQGSDWLGEEKKVEIKLGNLMTVTNANAEAGTGHFKETIPGDKVDPSMGNITVKVTGKTAQSTSWGAAYWQYFEDLDKITTAATPLKLEKKLFTENLTDNGVELREIKDGAKLKVGDKVKVRIVLSVDRDMEYVHMKDMRASCMEPVNVISSYKYQDGLGYYESTKDASTNFFFGWLSKGKYVFEYPMFVTHSGDFSNGITTIQCMYAPEFTSHSEGVRVVVSE